MSRIPKVWLAGREILRTIQDEQLSSNFRSCSCAGKFRELQATGQARVWHTAVTGTFLCLGSEVCVCVCVLSHDDSLGPHGQRMGFPRKEYWSGLPFPPPGDLPDPGIEPESSVFPVLAGGFFTAESLGKLFSLGRLHLNI